MAPIWEVKESTGRGHGDFTTRRLNPGTVIMTDRKVMDITYAEDAVRVTEQEVLRAYNALTEGQRARFRQLHEGERAFRTKVMRIFKANSFGTQVRTYLYLDASLFNHSCRPNAHMEEGTAESKDVQVIASKTVTKGEEIFISYGTHFACMTVAQRARLLHTYWGFQCDCTACNAGPGVRMVSDLRRQLINVMKFKVEGFDPPDYRSFKDLSRTTAENVQFQTAFVMRKLRMELTAQEQTAYRFLLAKLYEAEDLDAADIAVYYAYVGLDLAQQIRNMNDIIVLDSVRIAEPWIQKGLKVMETIHGKEAKRMQEIVNIRADAEHTNFGWTVRIMNSSAKTAIGNSFALLFDLGSSTGVVAYTHVLSKKECKDILRGPVNRGEILEARAAKRAGQGRW